jgi:hypothetical protein
VELVVLEVVELVVLDVLEVVELVELVVLEVLDVVVVGVSNTQNLMCDIAFWPGAVRVPVPSASRVPSTTVVPAFSE